MKYRREIDGLRAVAVVPVVLFHAGFSRFTGGFVGVDIFFVISGYLITTIILSELDKGIFSISTFYERRARRILPILFVVMASCSAFAYGWMLPDELKNFGQSLVATTLFSNNILLAITTGYWSLASEFKPLLHTWSLGVEEQYYVIFPLLLMIGTRFFRRYLIFLLCAIAILSLSVSNWTAQFNPDFAFYSLPTRAWELLIGSLVSVALLKWGIGAVGSRWRQFLGLFGLLLIVTSVFFFDKSIPPASFYTVIPVVGSALIIMFADECTMVGKLLSAKVIVGVGLISYGTYLWHQPLLAFARVYSNNQPGQILNACLVVASFGLAYFTWRHVETPFRNKTKVSRQALVISMTLLSLISLGFGLYLEKSYGAPERIYSPAVAVAADLDKRKYNSRVFVLKKNSFEQSKQLKILVVGNSFARDFVNMTTETFSTANVEIVYRDDLGDCIYPYGSQIAETLYSAADVIVFASGVAECVRQNIAYADSNGKQIYYSGTKHFGYNLNWIVRLDEWNLANQYNTLPNDTLEAERELVRQIPSAQFISLLAPIISGNQIPITDQVGRLISADRTHLTRFGAIYVGERALVGTRYGKLFDGRKT